ncbi:relaxase/mobilization nuclease domain-containing protein [Cerasicoccus frondis]|uniref:relaxase/mobilization nuclease domain-containing protein n=1 Tax=Cerasicoccus frondis TaxID=490090 RepID=UPI00285258C8|nr:relaxase/mobilization nuclease domain-containing protein [Cerasicoccus frondis]
MNPNVAKGGRSFKGAFQYYLNDKDAQTRERVAWTHTENMMTDNPDKAWKVMAYTAKSQDRLKQASGQNPGGAKLQKPVMAYSLAWHPEQDPSKEHMLDTALQSLKVLGLQDHEAVVIAHRDTPHRHVHVVANRVHPTTGMVASDSHSYRKLSSFAREYHEEHGLEYCPQRIENHLKMQQGERARYRDTKIADAWAQSDNGQSFAAALQSQGYRLAQGRRGLVVIDPYGKQINPVRQIEGIKTKDFRQRICDLDSTHFPEATELAKQVTQQHEQKKVAATQSKEAKAEFKKATNERSKPETKTDFAVAAKQEQKQTEPRKIDKPAPKEAPKQPLKADQSTTVMTQSKQNRTTANTQPVKDTFNRRSDKYTASREAQDKYLQARATISDDFQTRIINREKSLNEHYQLKERRAAITELESRCANPSLFRRVFGLTRRDRQELDTMKRSFAHAENRAQEQIDAIKAERDRALAKLEKEREERAVPTSPTPQREQRRNQQPRTTKIANDVTAPAKKQLKQEFSTQAKPDQAKLDELAAKQKAIAQKCSLAVKADRAACKQH